MTRQHVPEEPGPALARLAGQVDALHEDVARLLTLRGDVDALARTLTDLTATLHAFTDQHAHDGRHGPSGKAPATSDENHTAADPTRPGLQLADLADPAPNWLTVTDPAQAIRWMNELAVWMDAVYTRYDQHNDTPPCWPWHAEVIAELLPLQYQWRAATADDAGPDLLAAWHDRWRPGVARRTTKSLTGCARAGGRHVTGPGHRWTFDLTRLDEIAHWWATTHASSAVDPRHPAPGLTRDTSR